MAQPLQSKEQATPMLVRETLARGVKRQVVLALEHALLRIGRRTRNLGFQIGVKGGLVVLPSPDLQSEIVRHSKNPSPWVLDVFTLFDSGVQPQKHFLGPLLRLRGIKPEAQQVTVDIIP